MISQGNDIQILVCIPAFNEAKTITDVIEKAKKYATEVVVYDDGSVDNTSEIARASGATVLSSSRNRGYGVAIRALFQIAREKNADVMVTLDSDGQHDPDQIPSLLEPILKENFDIVIGSRFLAPQGKGKYEIPFYRTLGIRTITRFTRAVSYNEITDAQSGFRAYNKNSIFKINLFEDGMAVSTEILMRAKEKNLSIKEAPITISYDVSDPSTHNPFFHGAGVLYSVIQFISLRHPLAFYGLPGLVLLLAAGVFLSKALELFSATRYVSTNLILISLGMAMIGLMLLSTGAILHTLIALFKGKLKET